MTERGGLRVLRGVCVGSSPAGSGMTEFSERGGLCGGVPRGRLG
jgi:hypothetical protein